MSARAYGWAVVATGTHPEDVYQLAFFADEEAAVVFIRDEEGRGYWPDNFHIGAQPVDRRVKNPTRGEAALGAFVGSLGGSGLGAAIAGASGASALGLTGSVLGAYLAGKYVAADGRQVGSVLGATVGGFFGPLGAAIGSYVGTRKTDKERRKNPSRADESTAAELSPYVDGIRKELVLAAADRGRRDAHLARADTLDRALAFAEQRARARK